MLYLASTVFRYLCFTFTCIVRNARAASSPSIFVGSDRGDQDLTLVFALTSPSSEKANLCESCSDPEVLSTTALPKNAKLQ